MTSPELIVELERMLREPLPEPGDEEAWFFRWRPLLLALDAPALNLRPAFFGFIHHYVADVDIRRRDAAYRRLQDEDLLKHIDLYKLETEFAGS